MTGANPADEGEENPVPGAAFAARLTDCLAELPDEELLELAETVIADLDTVHRLPQ
jgi:hypothetical protein